MLPRGIRNNNPLNIRRSKDKWKGLRAVQADAQFCQFETLEYGWRAAFYLLTRTYYHKYRLYTIRSIISKWAPPIENKTDAYITVCIPSVASLASGRRRLRIRRMRTLPTCRSLQVSTPMSR